MTSTALTMLAARDALTDAIRFWERGRILFNAALTAIVAAYVIAGWPATALALNWTLAQQLFLLAVLANVAYCAAYVPDLVLQFSELRTSRTIVRWALFAVGLLFAAIITRFMVLVMLGIPVF